jgi:cell division septation protein DedD
LAAALLLAGASGVQAQTDPRLVNAVRAAQEGQGDSARATVQRLLDATPPTDTLYPQILYTQAMVANSAGDMRRHLQRVTVEYASSNWADDALLRLVQMDYATRNYDGAARNLERLRGDFPASPLMAQAAYWAARTYFDSNNPQAACRWLADGMAKAQTDIELQNQLGYLYQRCDLRSDSTTAQAPRPAGAAGAPGAAAAGAPGAAAPGAAAAGDSGTRDSTRTAAMAPSPNAPPSAAPAPGAPTPSQAPAPSPPKPTPPASPPAASTAPAPAPGATAAARTVYRVQIAAVGSRKAADDAARKARPLGLTVVTVQQGNLYKVRVGEYPTREAAQTAASSLKAKLGGNPFVVSEP